MKERTTCERAVTMSFKELRKKLVLDSKIDDIYTNIGNTHIKIILKGKK